MVQLVAAVVLVSAGPALAAAQTITFTHAGLLGSGTIGNTSFARRSFTITAVGDVSTRQSFFNGFSIAHASSSIAIEGLGTFGFTSATRTFVNNRLQIAGFSREVSSGLDLYNGPSSALLGAWDMLSSIGPLNGTSRLLQWLAPGVQTTGGQLVFNDDAAVTGTFQAVVGPTVVVPEPSTYAMLAVAMSALAVIARRRRHA